MATSSLCDLILCALSAGILIPVYFFQANRTDFGSRLGNGHESPLALNCLIVSILSNHNKTLNNIYKMLTIWYYVC